MARPDVQSICMDCARRLDGEMPEGHLATWNEWECGVCGKIKQTTEPRDFRWPRTLRLHGQ